MARSVGSIEGAVKIDHPYYLTRTTALAYFELAGLAPVAERLSADGHWGFLLAPGEAAPRTGRGSSRPPTPSSPSSGACGRWSNGEDPGRRSGARGRSASREEPRPARRAHARPTSTRHGARGRLLDTVALSSDDESILREAEGSGRSRSPGRPSSRRLLDHARCRSSCAGEIERESAPSPRSRSSRRPRRSRHPRTWPARSTCSNGPAPNRWSRSRASRRRSIR